ncbi:MAG: hypothetical protein ABSE50_20915 [Xanthobacteraceae bacterium]
MVGSTKERLIVVVAGVLAGILVSLGGLYVADYAHRRVISSPSLGWARAKAV